MPDYPETIPFPAAAAISKLLPLHMLYTELVTASTINLAPVMLRHYLIEPGIPCFFGMAAPEILRPPSISPVANAVTLA